MPRPSLLLVFLLLLLVSTTIVATSTTAADQLQQQQQQRPPLLTRQRASRRLVETHDALPGGSASSDASAASASKENPLEDAQALTFAEKWPFWSAFANSAAMIVVTELGDKTFFIAAVMAMRHPRLVVYAGAMGALAGMTVLSAAIGFALPQLLPKIYTHYASVVLFAFFGIKLLQEAHELYSQKDPKKNEELKEVEEQLGMVGKEEASRSGEGDAELGIKKESASHGGGEGGSSSSSAVTSAQGGVGGGGSGSGGSAERQLQSTAAISVLSQAFTLTFFAEWGDRSQIATIALASVHDPVGVTLGGILGHAGCTGLAVLGGRILATRISERHVALSGGILFLVFALHSLYVGP